MENARQSPPGDGYTDIIAPQQEEKDSDRAQFFHLLSVVDNEEAPETFVTPEFV